MQRLGDAWQSDFRFWGGSGMGVSRGLRMRTGYMGCLFPVHFRCGISMPGRIPGRGRAGVRGLTGHETLKFLDLLSLNMRINMVELVVSND